MNDYTTFNGIISKASYSGTDKQWLVDFLDRYDRSDCRIGKDDSFQLNGRMAWCQSSARESVFPIGDFGRSLRLP